VALASLDALTDSIARTVCSSSGSESTLSGCFNFSDGASEAGGPECAKANSFASASDTESRIAAGIKCNR